MLSPGHTRQEPSVSVGVTGLAILLTIYFALGHLSWSWDPWSGWLARAWGPTITLPPNAYTLTGTIRFP